MKPLIALSVIISLLAFLSTDSAAFEIEKSALFVYLNEVKPLEEEGLEALKEKDYALALRKYREALKGYEKIWKDYPDLPQERPYGLDKMVDESITTCKKVVEEIREKGEAQDEFYQKLRQMVRVDFDKKDIRNVAKMLTFLTDVNIIVDDTVFSDANEVLNPEISLRSDLAMPLNKVIIRICELTGLAYSIETDHVFITTRVKLDKQE